MAYKSEIANKRLRHFKEILSIAIDGLDDYIGRILGKISERTLWGWQNKTTDSNMPAALVPYLPAEAFLIVMKYFIKTFNNIQRKVGGKTYTLIENVDLENVEDFMGEMLERGTKVINEIQSKKVPSIESLRGTASLFISMLNKLEEKKEE